jgi:hypothetical protein
VAVQRQPQRRRRGNNGKEEISRGGPEGEGRTRERRGLTDSEPGQWAWQGTVRAEDNQGERSPRCAGQAIGERFLATDAPNTAIQTQLGVSDRSAQEPNFKSAVKRRPLGIEAGRPRVVEVFFVWPRPHSLMAREGHALSFRFSSAFFNSAATSAQNGVNGFCSPAGNVLDERVGPSVSIPDGP